MSNVEIMNSVYFKNSCAEQFHTSTFCGSMLFTVRLEDSMFVKSFLRSAPPFQPSAFSFEPFYLTPEAFIFLQHAVWKKVLRA